MDLEGGNLVRGVWGASEKPNGGTLNFLVDCVTTLRARDCFPANNMRGTANRGQSTASFNQWQVMTDI